MPREPRIAIEIFPAQEIRGFNVNQRIADQKLFDTLPGAASLLRYSSREISSATIQTALAFYNIDGVASVGLDIYQVRITISPAFDWEDIEPQVIDMIHKHLHWDDSDVRYIDRRSGTMPHGHIFGLDAGDDLDDPEDEPTHGLDDASGDADDPGLDPES